MLYQAVDRFKVVSSALRSCGKRARGIPEAATHPPAAQHLLATTHPPAAQRLLASATAQQCITFIAGLRRLTGARPLAGARLFALALLCVALAPAWLAPSAALAQDTVGIRAQQSTVVGDGMNEVVFVFDVTGRDAETHLTLNNAEAGMAVNLGDHVWLGDEDALISVPNGHILRYTTREIMPGAASIDVTFTITAVATIHTIDPSKRSATVTVIAPPFPPPTRIFLSNEDEVAATPGSTAVDNTATASGAVAQRFTVGTFGGTTQVIFVPRTLTLWFGAGTSSNIQSSDLTVAIWRHDEASGAPRLCDPPTPGGECPQGNRGKYFPLNPPSNLGGGGAKTFTHSGASDLGRNAPYHIVVEYRGSETLQLHQTTNADVSAGLTGWSIGDIRRGQDGAWTTTGIPQQNKLRFKLEGIRRNSPATGIPSVTPRGVPAIGQTTLTATPGTITDANGRPTSDADYSYQWLRYEADSNDFAAISGANGATYAVTMDDIDKRLGVRVRFADEDNYLEMLESGPATRAAVSMAPTVGVRAPQVIVTGDGANEFSFVFDVEDDQAVTIEYSITGTGYETERTLLDVVDGDMLTLRTTLLSAGSAVVPVTLTIHRVLTVGAVRDSSAASAMVAVNPVPNTPPGAPTGLVTETGMRSVLLKWQRPEEDGGSIISGYRIESAPDASGSAGTFTDLVANTMSADSRYTHDGLSAGQTRHYRVSAINRAGTVGPPTASAVGTAGGVPGAPRNLSAQGGPLLIDLRWVAPANTGGADVTGYRVESAPDSGGSAGTFTELVANTGNTNRVYVHRGLSNGQTRHYRVSAITRLGTGAASPQASASARASGSSGRARANFEPVYDESSLLSGVFVLGFGGPGVTINVDAITDSNGLRGVNFEHRLRIFNLDDSFNREQGGGFNTEQDFTYTSFAIGFNNKKLGVWLQYTDNDGNDEEIRTGPLTIALENPNSVPHISVEAAKTPVVGGSARGGEEAVFTLSRTRSTSNALTVAVAVTGSGAEYSDIVGITQVEFPANSRTAEVRVRTLSIAPGGADQEVTLTVLDRDGYVPAGSYVRLPGRDNDTYVLDPPGTVVTTAPPPAATAPGAPTGLSATAGRLSIVLEWQAPGADGGAAITGYRVERSADGNAPWTPIETNTMSTGARYTDSGLSAGQAFHYRVSAINTAGAGATSAPASAVAGGASLTATPGAPTGLSATAATKAIFLRWAAPESTGGSAVTGYRIEWSTNGRSGWSAVVEDTESTALEYPHIGLPANRTFHYRVSAINTAGAGAFSETADATTNAEASPPPPTVSVVAQDSTVEGNGLDDVVFFITTSDGQAVNTSYSIGGQSAITGRTAESRTNRFTSFRDDTYRRISTVELAPGSAPVDVTFTFIVHTTGLTESGHAIATGRGSATVTVTAPAARIQNRALVRTTARDTVGISVGATAELSMRTGDVEHIVGREGFSQAFRTGNNALGYNLHSIALLSGLTSQGRVRSNATVTLREANGNNPGDVVVTLQDPSAFRNDRLNVFRAPSGTTLTPDTTYHVAALDGRPGNRGAGTQLTLNRAASDPPNIPVHRLSSNVDQEASASWRGASNLSLMLQVRGSEVVDLSLPEITVRAEADTVLGDGLNFVRFSLVRSGNFPQRAVQYTLTESAALNDALETNTEATYTYSGSGTSELIRVRTGNLTPGSAPLDVTFNLLPGTGYRIGDPGSKTVTVTPLPAPLLVGNQEAVREALAVVRRGRDYAQKFTTGSNTGGYTLDAVVVSTGSDPLRSGYDPSVPVTMTIRGEDPSGDPASAVVGTLTEPATIIDGRNAFTAQGTIELDAETSYYVVISQDVPASTGGIPLDGPRAAQNAFDSDSLAGWSIEDRLLWNQDGSWGHAGNNGANRALTIRLAGNALLPATPTITVARQDAFVISGREAVFTLTRTASDISAALTVDIALTGEEASYSDYAGRATTATFAENENTAVVRVPTADLFQGALDIGEINTVVLTVQDGTGYTAVAAPNNTATITLTGPPLQARIARAAGQAEMVDEGDDVQFTVTLYQPFSNTTATAGEAFMLRYALNNSACSITGGVDADDLVGDGTGTLEFEVGDGTKEFTITTRLDSDNTEASEGLCLEILPPTTPVNAYGIDPGPTTRAQVTVRNAAPLPTTLPLVSNTGVAGGGISLPSSSRSLAQPFTTGNHNGGYNLDSIVLQASVSDFDQSVPLVVTLREEASGFPSTTVWRTLATVTPQSQYLARRDDAGVALLSFRAPRNTTLAASTTYYVVVEQAVATGGFGWRQVQRSSGLDAGTATGWSISDTFRVFSSGAWGASDRSTHAMKIQVRGSAVGGPILPVVRVAAAETEMVPAFEIGAVTAGNDVVFVFTRDITTGPLTVNIAWVHTTPLVNMNPPTTVMFEGGAAEARLALPTELALGDTRTATATLNLQQSTGYPDTAAYVAAGPLTATIRVRPENSPATGNTVLTGTAQVGERLSIGLGTFADADSVLPTAIMNDDLDVDQDDFQWQREDPVGTWNDITGDEGTLVSRYLLVAADAGKRIRVRIRYTDLNGYDEEVISTPTPFVAAMGAAAPAANTAADGTPTISGTLQVDEELTAVAPTSGAGAITDDNGPSPLQAASFNYQWRRADDDAGMNEADISGATDATYTLVTADEGKHIQVVVSFTDAVGYDERVESDWTSEAVAAAPMPTMTAPGAPTGLTATAGPLSIRLGWTAPGDDGGAAITGYRIERASGDCSDSPAFTERVADTGSAGTSHTDMNLTAGETWCYRVSAINSEGEGAASNTASATAGAAPATMTAPGAPTGLTATAGPLSIRLGWTAPGDDGGAAIIGYRIERASGDCSGMPAFMELVADTGSTGTSHTDMNLSAGEDWCYRVSAINSVDTGAASNTASAAAAVVVTAPVTPPTGLSASSDVGQIRLNWTAPSDDGGSAITGYRIERASGDCSGSPAFMERVANTGSAGTSHTDTGLTTGETWCYRVSAINAEGRSPVSGTDSALVLAAGEVEVELAHATLDATEGDADATLEITVTVSPAPAGELSIPYQVVAATGAAQQATADADFTLPAGPLLIAAGESSGVITATISADNISEPAEGFALMLGAPTSSNAGETPSLGGRSGAEVLIAANDPLMFTLTASEEPVSEGESVTYTLAPAAEGPELAAGVELEFAWALSGGDATAGDDYRTEPADTYTGAFTFSAADAAAMTVSVDIVLDNVVENEEDETFLFSVTTPANAAAETGGLTLTPADGVLTTTITNVVDLPPVFSGVRVQNQLWTQGVPVSLELPTATGGNGELSYTLTPQLPRGLLLNDRIISGAPNVETAATTYRWKVTDSDTNVEDSDSAMLAFTIQVQDVETHEDQVHAATHAALALLAPNLASGAVQVLTTRFENLAASGRQDAARNTLSLGGKPLGAFADEAGSGLDVAREVASFFGFHLPQTYQYGGGAFAAGGGGVGGYGAAGGYGGAGGYGAAGGYGVSGTGGAAGGGGYGASGTGDAAGGGVTGTGAAAEGGVSHDGAAFGNAGGASAELAFAPATPGALEAEATENNTGGRGADEVSDWRSQRLDSWLGVGAFQSPDLRSLLSQSSFSVTFGPALGAAHGPAHGAADDPGSAADGLFGGRWTLWGQGAADGFEGRDKASALWVEGESISAYLGADVQQGGLALGVALGRNTGDLDYRDAANQGGGDLKTELTSLHPYLNWSPNPGFNMYLLLGYGVGEGKLEVENLPSKLSSDLEMRMVALGGRRTLAGFATARRFEVKVDAFLVELESEGAEASPGGVNWRAVDTQSGRLRMALAGAAPLLEGANHLLAEGELAARMDGGDAQTGVGAELGAGLRWLRGGFSLAARGRLLLVHSESDFEDYKEWGASLEASYDAGEVGRGFRATLSPVWGDAGSGAGALYESAGALRGFAGGGASQGRRGLLPDHLNFEFGYGVGLLNGRAMLLPFGSFTFAGGGEASDTRLRLGTRFDLSHAVGGGGDGALAVQRLGFELFGEEQAGEGASREQRFGLELRLGF